jgi:hypothetical protein
VGIGTQQVSYRSFSVTYSSTSQPTFEPTPEQKITVTPNLSPAERLVAETWNRVGGLLASEAQQLAIDPGVAVSVWVVESSGQAFGPDRRMTIRFENHVFFDRWGKDHPDLFHRHFTFNPDPSRRWTKHQWRPAPDQPWRDVHTEKQDSDWDAFEFACTLDDTAARLSISMGAPQIMGFNYQIVGYTSVQHMFEDFAASEGNQVAGFFRFVSSQGAVPMLQSSDFKSFATLYNGSSRAAEYEGLIRGAYQAYRRLRPSRPAPPEVPGDEAPAPSFVDLISRLVNLLRRR